MFATNCLVGGVDCYLILAVERAPICTESLKYFINIQMRREGGGIPERGQEGLRIQMVNIQFYGTIRLRMRRASPNLSCERIHKW